jgi:hypothetical protein
MPGVLPQSSLSKAFVHVPARIKSGHRSRPMISRRKPALSATRRSRRLRLSAVAHSADSATGRSPTLADRRLHANPPPPPAIGKLYPPNAHILSGCAISRSCVWPFDGCYRLYSRPAAMPRTPTATRFQNGVSSGGSVWTHGNSGDARRFQKLHVHSRRGAT